MSKEENCKVNIDELSSSVEKAELPDSESDSVKRFLTDLKDSADQSSLFFSDKKLLCYDEKTILDNIQTRDLVSISSLEKLDKLIDPAKDSSAKAGEIMYVVYEGPRIHGITQSDLAHLRTVADVLKHHDPESTDANILLFGGSTKVKTESENKSKEEKDKAQHLAFGKQVIEDLKVLGPIVEKNPGVTINISFDIYNFFLQHDKASSEGSPAEKIKPAELGLEQLPAIEDFSNATAEQIKSSLEKQDREDVKTLLAVVSELNKLTEKGAKIKIAWGNHDQLGLTELVAQLNDKIKSVTADEFKSFATSKLAAQSDSGKVLFLPEDIAKRIKRGGLKEVSISSSFSPPKQGSLIGADLERVKVLDADFPRLKQVLLLDPSSPDLSPNRNIFEAESARQDPKNSGIRIDLGKAAQNLYEKFANKYGAELARKELGTSQAFEGKVVQLGKSLHEIKFQQGKEDPQMAYRMELEFFKQDPVQKLHELYIDLEMLPKLEQLGYKRDQSEASVQKNYTRLLKEFADDRNRLVSSSALNTEQMLEVFGKRAEKALADMKRQGISADLFNVKNEFELLLGQFSSYVVVELDDGRSVLAAHTLGSSFAAPAVAAKESFKARKAGKKN